MYVKLKLPDLESSSLDSYILLKLECKVVCLYQENYHHIAMFMTKSALEYLSQRKNDKTKGG